ncbi:MAG: 4'-phosphopantetheinyl transferase superfamily protein [Bacteroidota bacterium]
MVGNDIVDLQLAKKESNWRRPRFLAKLFTETEQHFLATAQDKELAVWLLWSQKESAYKIVARMEKRRFYAPKRLVTSTVQQNLTTSLLPREGQVAFEKYTFFTKSKVTDTYIHTIAQLDGHQPLVADSFQLAQRGYHHQRKSTRQKLLERYAQKKGWSINDLRIQKDEWKVPHLYHKNQRQTVQISMAHHGYFGGYVLC